MMKTRDNYDLAGLRESTGHKVGLKRNYRWVVMLLAVIAVLFITGCASNAPLDTLDPAGRKSNDINNLINPIFVIAGIVFVIIQGAVLYLGWKFKVREPKEGEESFDGGYPDEEFPKQVHGHFAAEIGWTIGPTILMAAIAIFSVGALLNLDDVDAAPDEAVYPEMEVLVVGQQWWWEFQYYLDGVDGAEQPDFVTANEIGRFAGQCTEFCGLSHAYMRMYAVSLTQEDFQTWTDNQMRTREPLQEGDENYEGEQVFLLNCARCHVINGVTSRDLSGSVELDTMALYGNIEEYRNHADGTLSQGKYTGPENLTAGAAPNLTHFATRSSYAGSFFQLYPDAQEMSDAGNYLELAGSDYARGTLEAWLRNSPKEKPNAQPEQARGMPNLNLSEADIDLLVDYLISLD